MSAADLPTGLERIVIGADSHAAYAAAISEARPELEIRARRVVDVSDDDLAWGDVYIGFRPPPRESLGRVQWVHSTGAGVDVWLYPRELPKTVLLTRSSESFGPMIAEWALTRALVFSQQIVDLDREQQQGLWSPRKIALLRGTRAVIVGTGDVGSHVGALFRALGCEVDGVSRTGTGDPSIFSSVAPVSRLQGAVGGADWLVLMLPLTAQTHGLIDREVLRRCTGAMLINAGRGAVVTESVLPEALDQGWLRGAALDVFETEPLPATSPLWADRRVMISPHISGLTTVTGAVGGFLECLDDIEHGRRPKWAVDRDRQY